jgi:uncharacterized iron-regulated membrane protein
MYRGFLVFHRWLALVVSAFLIVIGLSGAVVVLEGPVGQAYATTVVRGDAPLSLDTLAARAQIVTGPGTVMMMGLGESPDLAWSVLIANAGNPRAGPRGVMLNPYTGAIVEERKGTPAAISILRAMHQLHTRLLSGGIGNTIVWLATVCALVLVVTGLILWWREKLWRVNATASWKRVNFDLHHALGVFAAIVLLLITSTGIWVHFNQIDGLLRKLDRSPTPPQPVQPATEPGAKPVSLDSLARAARAAIPGAAIMLLQLPPAERAPAMVWMKYPEDHTPAGRSRVTLDKFRGTVLLATSTRTAEPGQHLINIKRALHTGDIYGTTTQIIWALASLVLASQAVTGVLMWWNARAGRRKRDERDEPTPTLAA